MRTSPVSTVGSLRKGKKRRSSNFDCRALSGASRANRSPCTDATPAAASTVPGNSCANSGANAAVKELGVVTISGGQPTSLPTQIPTTIVQGRFDMICPPTSAWALAQGLPKARLHMIPLAGHALSEPGISDALVRAMNQLRA